MLKRTTKHHQTEPETPTQQQTALKKQTETQNFHHKKIFQRSTYTLPHMMPMNEPI